MAFAALALAFCASCASVDTFTVQRIEANENRVSAGVLREGVLSLNLELRRGRWYPESEHGLSEVVLAFADGTGAPAIPGPLVRVRQGTRVRATILNTLPDLAITVHGLGSPATTGVPSRSDSVHIPAGATSEIWFEADEVGTFFYWGTVSGRGLEERTAEESQLYGALIVDPNNAETEPADRVFVMGVWGVPPDTTEPKPWVPRDMMVINGKSWPFTERFTYQTGETVVWRWLNPTKDAHPMHLHGFYFDVTSRGTWAADTVYGPQDRREVVTEMMLPGGTMTMQWVPRVPGNWLFHCHFPFHVSHFLSFAKVPDPENPGAPDAVEHHAEAMRGLVLGIHVQGAATEVARNASPPRTGQPRQLRLLAQAASNRYGTADGYGYLLDEGRGSIRADSVPNLSSMIVLRRGEPVQVTVVNRLRAPTAVHWHGIEMQDSYSDGVPGWSGRPGRIAPAIAPADSFVAEFTPTRAGTFIYHAHSHEQHQIASGLYGPLLVLEPDVAYDSVTDRTFVIAGNGPDFGSARINGEEHPRPIDLAVGTTYRFRIIHINPDWRVSVSLEGAEGPIEWRAVAKDGADLPPSQAAATRVPLLMGTGETADFEFTPSSPGRIHLLAATREGWQLRVPLDVGPQVR